jgi:regulator of replication initiation timing
MAWRCVVISGLQVCIFKFGYVRVCGSFSNTFHAVSGEGLAGAWEGANGGVYFDGTRRRILFMWFRVKGGEMWKKGCICIKRYEYTCIQDATNMTGCKTCGIENESAYDHCNLCRTNTKKQLAERCREYREEHRSIVAEYSTHVAALESTIQEMKKREEGWIKLNKAHSATGEAHVKGVLAIEGALREEKDISEMWREKATSNACRMMEIRHRFRAKVNENSNLKIDNTKLCEILDLYEQVKNDGVSKKADSRKAKRDRQKGRKKQGDGPPMYTENDEPEPYCA